MANMPLFPFGGGPAPVTGPKPPTLPTYTIGGGSVPAPTRPVTAPTTAPTFGIGGGVKVPTSGNTPPYGYSATPTTLPTYSIPIPGTSLFQPTNQGSGGTFSQPADSPGGTGTLIVPAPGVIPTPDQRGNVLVPPLAPPIGSVLTVPWPPPGIAPGGGNPNEYTQTTIPAGRGSVLTVRSGRR